MITLRNKVNILHNQTGLVSFVVTLIIMVILSLIVIGFSTLTRREQRQALDKQLKTQAFYAAESGVNDASEALDAFIAANPGVALPSRTACDDTAPPWNTLTPNLETDQTVQYTCVLVNPNTPDIVFNEVDTDSKVAPLNSSDGSAFTTFTIRWQNSEASVPPDTTDCDANGLATDGSFPAANIWGCSVGVMRVDIVPTPDSGFTRTNLINNVMTAFFYPAAAGDPALVYGTAAGVNQGAIVRGTCTGTPTVCQASIDVSARSDARYMMRVRGIYHPSQLTITSVGRTFRDAQAIIDSTGRAQDVLHRIQVRKPIGTISNPLLADFTLESNSICKRYEYIPGATGSVTTLSPDCSF